jgi:hypothetical protein
MKLSKIHKFKVYNKITITYRTQNIISENMESNSTIKKSIKNHRRCLHHR